MQSQIASLFYLKSINNEWGNTYITTTKPSIGFPRMHKAGAHILSSP